MTGIVQGMVTPHSPQIANRDRVKPPFDLMRDGLAQLGTELDLSADAVILVSCHFLSTLSLYVDAASRHRGIITARECPDLVASIPYDFLGFPELAQGLAEKAQQHGIPLRSFVNSDFILDYGTVVPAQYILPRHRIPLVPLSVSLTGTLDEAVELGRTIRETAEELQLKVVVIASGALSHRMVRESEQWPLGSDLKLDREFLDVMRTGHREATLAALPKFAQMAQVEAEGKHLGCLLGAMPEHVEVQVESYGPSSGSGNASVLLRTIFPRSGHA